MRMGAKHPGDSAPFGTPARRIDLKAIGGRPLLDLADLVIERPASAS